MGEITVETLLVGTAVLLIVAAVFGGGIDTKFGKIPSLVGIPRVAAVLLGFVFLSIWLIGFHSSSEIKPTHSKIPPAALDSTTEASISLIRRQSSTSATEFWAIWLNGMPIGSLVASDSIPTSRIMVNISKSKVDYQLVGTIDTGWIVEFISQGSFIAKEGGRYRISATSANGKEEASIVED